MKCRRKNIDVGGITIEIPRLIFVPFIMSLITVSPQTDFPSIQYNNVYTLFALFDDENENLIIMVYNLKLTIKMQMRQLIKISIIQLLNYVFTLNNNTLMSKIM